MNKKVKIIVGLLVIVVIAIIISVVSSSKKETVKIGYIGPMTGPLGVTTGESIIHAFKMANKDNPSIGNKKIEVVYEDDVCSDIKKAVSGVQKLIEVDKVDILVNGLCSGSVLATAPLAEKAHVVMITPGATAPSVTKAGDYIFRISASSVTGGKQVADLLKDKNYKTIAFILENNEFPLGWKDSFVAEYGKSNPNTKYIMESVVVNSTDLRSPVTKLISAKPDIIIALPLMPSTANIMLNQIHELGYKGELIGNEIFSLQSVIHNKYAENMLVTVYDYSNTSADFQKFLTDYKQMFKKDIQEEIYGAMSYDTYNLIVEAKKTCENKGSDCMKDYLYNIKDYRGLSGKITIDSNGDTQREFSLKKIIGGKVVEIK